MLGNLKMMLFLILGSKRIASDERIIGGSVVWKRSKFGKDFLLPLCKVMTIWHFAKFRLSAIYCINCHSAQPYLMHRDNCNTKTCYFHSYLLTSFPGYNYGGLPEEQLPWSTITAHGLLTVCSQTSHSVLTVCSQRAHSVFTVCSQCAHSQLTVRSQSAHSPLTVRSQSAHSLFTVHSQSVYSPLSLFHSLHSLFIVCSQCAAIHKQMFLPPFRFKLEALQGMEILLKAI